MKKSVIVAMLVAFCAAVWATSPEEMLIHAIRDGDTKILQEALNQGANPNYTDASGKSALMYACENEWYEGVKTLLEKDVDVDASDKDGKTALMYACEKQWYEGVKVLLRKGVDVNASKKSGETALLYAVQNMNIIIVRLLVYEDADINASDYKGKTALMYAIEEKDYEIVDLLLRRKADLSATDINGNTVAIYAVKYQNHVALDKLLEKGSRIDWNQTNKEGVSPFTAACMRGDFSAIKQLLKKAHVDVSASRIDGLPILIWLIANRKAPAIIKCIIGYCSPAEILLTTDDLGHDIKYWAEKQGYESVLALLDEIKEKGLW